ncbi:MAG: DUF192 domain-containing protein [Candidatus Saccharimonadales bacterium]
MQKAKDDVTESGPKNRSKSYLYVLLLIVLAGVLGLLRVVTTKGYVVGCPIAVPIQKNADEYISRRRLEGCISLEIANTDATRVMGLSGRENMEENSGLLFVFPKPGKQCIWMKDMNFALDIIWLDSDKKITAIKKDVKPESYPDAFCPSDDAKYVIELNSGVSSRAGLQVGQKISL